MDDWETHLSTVFPDVRLKKFLEMRGADGGPWSMICALPALWVGLIYDEQAQKECLEMISDWTIDDMTALREEVRLAPFFLLRSRGAHNAAMHGRHAWLPCTSNSIAAVPWEGLDACFMPIQPPILGDADLLRRTCRV